MAEFTDSIFNDLMREEGRVFTDDPADPGGPTNRGVTLAVAREMGLDLDDDGDVDAADVRAITDPVAKQVALARYWNAYRCGELIDQSIAARYFSIVYNTPAIAMLAVQRAVRACGGAITVDGKAGPATMAAANACYAPALLAAFRSEVAGEYRLLVAHTPAKAKWLPGWEARAYR